MHSSADHYDYNYDHTTSVVWAVLALLEVVLSVSPGSFRSSTLTAKRLKVSR
jgi:hypothetical protein